MFVSAAGANSSQKNQQIVDKILRLITFEHSSAAFGLHVSFIFSLLIKITMKFKCMKLVQDRPAARIFWVSLRAGVVQWKC